MMKEPTQKHDNWMHQMFRASLLLASGSALLLLGSLLWIYVSRLGYPDWWTDFGPSTVRLLLLSGLFTHILGWAALAWAIGSLKFGHPELSERRRKAVARTYWASFLGVGIGLLTLPLALPGSIGAFFLLGGLFPIVASVYSPVVFLHALLFSLSAGLLNDRRASIALLGGSGVLVALAQAGLSFQFLSFPGVPGILASGAMGGLTAIGYATVGIGWLVASRSGPSGPAGDGTSAPS